MSYYETLYIVHPALESGRLKDIILSLEESLKKLGGKTLSIDLWGKKRLAYFIDKQKYGTYVQLQFTGEGDCVSGFGLELEHNPNVLSYLTTLIEEDDVVEKEDDLDTQIAGQSRESQNIGDRSKKEDNNSSKNNKTSLVEANVAEGTETPVEKSVEAGGKEDPASGEEVNDPGDKLEEEKIDVVEKSTDSVEENQENADETTAVSKEE